MRNEFLPDVIAGSAGVLVVLAAIGLPKDPPSTGPAHAPAGPSGRTLGFCSTARLTTGTAIRLRRQRPDVDEAARRYALARLNKPLGDTG